MRILITGGSGFVGSTLTSRLLEQGHVVYSVSRHPPESHENLIGLQGDILKPDLGLRDAPADIDCLYHLAAVVQLGPDKNGVMWRTNAVGTRNVTDFCMRHGIRHLLFCSTAYTAGNNEYESSKRLGEMIVKHSGIPRITIFKPSIVIGAQQHISQFVSTLIRVHRRAEIIRRHIEGTLRLPVLTPVFRIKGNPQGFLNLVPVEAVVNAMVCKTCPGTYWLTNPRPPTLEQITTWVGEFVLLDFRIEQEFKATPLELAFARMTRAFQPYLKGDNFPSDILECPPVGREFIERTVRALVKRVER